MCNQYKHRGFLLDCSLRDFNTLLIFTRLHPKGKTKRKLNVKFELTLSIYSSMAARATLIYYRHSDVYL